mmetsp:Transcript_53857/g.96961  ORF Transcript_53857/g.96961 Transcript_53857/m.96961 type:complete len:232 (-) Transcript_53857:935-1630(-)
MALLTENTLLECFLQSLLQRGLLSLAQGLQLLSLGLGVLGNAKPVRTAHGALVDLQQTSFGLYKLAEALQSTGFSKPGLVILGTQLDGRLGGLGCLIPRPKLDADLGQVLQHRRMQLEQERSVLLVCSLELPQGLVGLPPAGLGLSPVPLLPLQEAILLTFRCPVDDAGQSLDVRNLPLPLLFLLQGLVSKAVGEKSEAGIVLSHHCHRSLLSTDFDLGPDAPQSLEALFL